MINSFDNLVCFVIGRTRKVIIRRINDELLKRGVPVTFDQFIFLFKLSGQEGQVSQQVMADLTGKDKSAILRTIAILEKKGLVHRTPDLTDKRRNLLWIAPAGAQLFEKVTLILDEVNAQLKKNITDPDYETLINALNRIQENANHTQNTSP